MCRKHIESRSSQQKDIITQKRQVQVMYTKGWIPKFGLYFYSFLFWVFLSLDLLKTILFEVPPANIYIIHTYCKYTLLE